MPHPYQSSATISGCGQYRYRLSRLAGDAQPLAFIMLNPSTADASIDDPTIRRCIGFAASHGYAGINVFNLYALRATDPKELWTHPDPVGPDNDFHLNLAAAQHKQLVCAWGGNAKPGRVDHVRQLFLEAGCQLKCLGKNKDGSPKHPLYLPSNSQLIPW